MMHISIDNWLAEHLITWCSIEFEYQTLYIQAS